MKLRRLGVVTMSFEPPAEQLTDEQGPPSLLESTARRSLRTILDPEVGLPIELRRSCDERQPIVVAARADAVAKEFIAIASRLDRSTRAMVRRHVPVTSASPAIGDGATVRPICEKARTM
jgi:hypothetical protein